jgi:uncharacterized membrane protein YbhN (UPF0104 family)
MRIKLSRRAWSRLLSILVIGAVGWLFASSLYQGWSQVQQYDISIKGEWLLAIFLFAVAVLASGLLWGRILRSLHVSDVKNREFVRSHLAAWLMRYIPGVGFLTYKISWAKSLGIKRSLAVLAIFYESIFLQLASILGGVSVILLVAGTGFYQEGIVTTLLIITMVILLVLGVSKPVVKNTLSLLSRGRFGKKLSLEDLPLLPGLRSLFFIVEYTIPRLVNGLAAALVASAVLSPTAQELLIVGAAYVIAGALGILAFFTPSGLGVREGSFTLILSITGTPVVDAIFLSLLLRLLSTLADLVVTALLGIFTAIKAKGARKIA